MIGIDLFCGIGGMSLGFHEAGFDIRAAVDNDMVNAAYHKANFPVCRTIAADLMDLDGDQLNSRCGLDSTDVTVVFGGPPCQGFSRGGKHRKGDVRNQLILEFIRLVGEISPSYFVMENVDGLLSPKHGALLEQFELQAKRWGYRLVKPIRALDAADFGVPQRRKRVFIIGYKHDVQPPEYPASRCFRKLSDTTHSPNVWDAIGDLAVIDEHKDLVVDGCYNGQLGKPSEYAQGLRCMSNDGMRTDIESDHIPSFRVTSCHPTRHSPETINRFLATSPGTRENVSRFWRLSKSGVSPTLRAGTGPSNGSFTAPRPIHPVSPRCITVREAARLHSYPDWFTFHPTKWHGFRQIGNSVPPFLAREVAKQVIQAAVETGEGYKSMRSV